MSEIKEKLDEMIGKTPATKSMVDALKAAAEHGMVTQRHIVRLAVQEYLERHGWIKPRQR